MASLKVREIKKSLLAKGFIEDKKSGNTDHHYYRLYNQEGEITGVTTKISRGETEISDLLISLMAKQLGLRKREFIRYTKCEMSKEQYYKKCKHLK